MSQIHVDGMSTFIWPFVFSVNLLIFFLSHPPFPLSLGWQTDARLQLPGAPDDLWMQPSLPLLAELPQPGRPERIQEAHAGV